VVVVVVSDPYMAVRTGGRIYPVVQQPDWLFISNGNWTLTQYSVPVEICESNVLLAHRQRPAGAMIGRLEIGDYLMWKGVRYVVVDLEDYQALDGSNPYTDYLTEEGERISSTDHFYRAFCHPGALVLMTCIIRNGQGNWGRRVVLAFPGKFVI
jgi:hypothetical protein